MLSTRERQALEAGFSRRQFLTTISAALASVATTSIPAVAGAPAGQLNFPAGRPITMIIPVNPGGAMDVGARTLQPYWEKTLGAKLVLINKPAAGAQVGLSEVAHSKPNGYTLVMVSFPSHNGVWLDSRRKNDFKRKDFIFLGNMVRDPNCILVKSDSPYKTIQDLAKAAKEKPGTIPITMSTPIGDDHLMVLDLMSKTDADFNVINNDGNAPAVQQFLGGHAQALACNESEAVALVKRGDTKILAMAHPQRTKYNPNTSTFREMGLDIISFSMRGFATVAGTPQPIVDFLANALHEAIENKEFLEKMEKLGYPVEYLGPKEFTEAAVEQDAKLTRLARKYKLFEPVPQD